MIAAFNYNVFPRTDFHSKKEHSRSYVTDERGKVDRKDA